MRKLLKIVAWIAVVLMAVCVALLWYSGFFEKTQVEERQIASFYVAFRDHQGSYSDAQMIQNRVFLELLRDSIVPVKGVGVFFDDPSFNNTTNFRFRVGCIISSTDLEKAYASISGYRIMAISSARYLMIQLPFENRMSSIGATTKAYYAFKKYRNARGMKKRPVIEIYDEAAGSVTIMTEIAF